MRIERMKASKFFMAIVSMRLCQNSFVSLRARPAMTYYPDSQDRMRYRVKPGKTQRERLHHFDTPMKTAPTGPK